MAWRTVLPSNDSGKSKERALADAMKRGSVRKRASASERVISSNCARMRRGRVAGSRGATLRMVRPLATLGRALERSLAKLKPVFERPWGQVTAGNSSQITDGASWVILASEEAVAKHGLTPKAVILDSQWSALDPRAFAAFERQCGWAKPFFVSGLAPAN